VWASSFAYAVAETAAYLVLPPVLVEKFSYDPAVVGVWVAVVGAASLAVRFPVGEAYGRGRGLVSGVVGAGVTVVAVVLLILPAGSVRLLLALVGLGFGFSVASTLQLATLSSIGQGRGLGSSLGWYTAAVGVGHMVGGISAGSIADAAGIAAVFWFILVLASAGTALLVAAERLASRFSLPPSQLPAEPSAGSRTRAGQRWGKRLVMAFTLLLVINVFQGSVSAFHPLMALDAGLTLSQIGVLLTVMSLASTSVRVGAGLLLRRSDGGWLNWPLILLGACGVALMPVLRTSMLAQVPLFAAMGASRGLLRITASSVAMSGQQAPHSRGNASATINTGLDLGRLAGPLLGSGLVSTLGLHAMFPALAAAGVVAFWVASRVGGRGRGLDHP
jgi:predicted MFS family arabinose efflux permease